MRGGRGPGTGGKGRGSRFSSNPRSSMVKDSHTDRPHSHRPRRSLSPPERRQRPPTPSRRSASVERREYFSRRLDHGKQSRSRPAPSGDEGLEFPHKYMLPELNPVSKPSRAIKDVEFNHQGRGALALASAGLGKQGMLLQNSMSLDNRASQNFYTMPLDTGFLHSTTPLKSETMEGDLNVGFRDREMLRYRELPRDPYVERDKENMYPRDTSSSLIPSSQAATFGGSSSSSLAKEHLSILAKEKENLSELYRDRLLRPYEGFSRDVGVSKLPEDPLERNDYSQVHLSDLIRRRPPSPLTRDGSDLIRRHPPSPLTRDGSDLIRRRPPSPLTRDGPQDYIHYERNRSKRSDQGFLGSDNVYKNVQWAARGDYNDTLGPSYIDLTRDRVDRADIPHKNSSDNSFWNQHRSLRGDATVDYRDMKVAREDYACGSGSGHAAFRMRSSRDDELAYFEDRYALTRESAPMAYREIPRSPPLSDHHMAMYQRSVSPSQGMSHMDIYDPSERMVRRKYVMDNDEDRFDSRGILSNDRSVFRRMQSPSDDMWSNEDRVEFLHSKRLTFGHPQHRTSASRMSKSDDWRPTDSAPTKGGRGMSLKRRLKHGPSKFHDSFPSERRHHFVRPKKFWKRGFEDGHTSMDAHHEDANHGDAYDVIQPLVKTDPPEDSEEFKNQVHKAFLRFSKALNESLHQQKRYREQGKAGSLLCCACGSTSEEFVGTHNLVTHTYNFRKVGFRTEHLGLHKALCVLMGWNWLMPPDDGKLYQSTHVAEAKAMKEDLILWPPVVIIHNSSIGKRNDTNGAKVVPIEGMEEILRDMGFEAGKARVCRGKPANQSLFVVKFMPTFSGLQEAERLHTNYADSNRGRQELQQITAESSSDGNARVDHTEKVEEILYGYLAVPEDLNKLDAETKKRCLVKSKKDIQAIADAPLNAD